MAFATTATEKMRITSGGNVLVGTTTNRLRLTVSGSDANAPTLGTASGTMLLCNAAGTSEYGTMFGIAATGYGWIQQQRVDATATAYFLSLQPSGGNLLVGTTTDAGYKLDVNGTGRFSGYGTANSIMTEPVLRINGSNGFNIGSDGTNALIGVLNSGTDMIFLKRVAGVYSAALTINSSGNVGIGTTSPSNILSIEKSSNSGSASGFPTILLKNTLATQGDGTTTYNFSNLLVSSGNGAVDMYFGTTYAAGTWAPAGIINVATNHPLQFKTNNTLALTIASTGAATFSGSVTAPQFIAQESNSASSTQIQIVNTSNANNTTKTAQLLFRLADTASTVKSAAYIRAIPEGVNVLSAALSFATRSGDSDPVERLSIASTGAATFSSSVTATTLIVNTSGQSRTISTFYGAGSDGNNIFIGGGGLSSGTGGGASYLGSYNTANGVNALFSNTTGYYNTANGLDALFYNTTGFQNAANGVNALFSNTTGVNNTANGVNALYSNTTGYQNTANGYQAGYGTGTNANTTGSNNIFIGNESVGVSATESNRTWIGNSLTTSTWLGGNLLIGTTTDGGYKLDVNGTGRFSGALSGTSVVFSSSIVGTGGVMSLQKNGSGTVGSGAYFTLYNTATTEGMLWQLNASNNIDFWGLTSNSFTASPVITLTRAGAATFSSSVTAGGIIYTNAGYFKVENTNWVTSGESTNLSSFTSGTETVRLFTTAENVGGYAGFGIKTLRAGGDGLATRLFISSTGAATFSGVLSANNTITIGNGVTAANSSLSLLGVASVSYTWSITNDANGLSFGGGTNPSLRLNGATGAATFSSSVTASQGNFNQIGNGFAITMTNRNANQTWGLIVDTDAVDDKILGLQSSYGFTPFYALKLEASGGAATFSSSIKTAAPSGGTAKPFKIGAAATVTPTSQNRTIEIEIDGTTYYLTAKTTND